MTEKHITFKPSLRCLNCSNVTSTPQIISQDCKLQLLHGFSNEIMDFGLYDWKWNSLAYWESKSCSCACGSMHFQSKWNNIRQRPSWKRGVILISVTNLLLLQIDWNFCLRFPDGNTDYLTFYKLKVDRVVDESKFLLYTFKDIYFNKIFITNTENSACGS